MNQNIEWVFKGKMRAHTLDITDLCFGEIKPNKPIKLYSISKDMHLVEYKIIFEENQTEKEVVVENCHRIESNHEPTACILYNRKYCSSESVLVVNSEYKLKNWGYQDN